MMRHTDNK